MLYLVKQDDVMGAIFGQSKSWQACGSYFACGTPMTNDENTDWFKHGQDIAKAKELFQKAGYDGKPVVVLQATDHYLANPAGLFAAQWLRQAGINVDLAAMDWGALLTRRAVKKPPAEGGWNIFSTTVTGITFADPISFTGQAANGEKAWFGWPTNRAAGAAAQQMGDWRRRSTARKEIAKEMQKNGWDYVPHVILGQFFRNSAWRKNITRRDRHARGGRVLEHGESGESVRDARLHRPPPRLDGARDGHRRGVRVPAAASLARRSGRDHRGRQRDAASRSPASASSSASTMPLPVQFFRWVAAVLQGDLGISIFSNEPVAKLISQRIEPTLSLALTTLIVAVTLAVCFGVLAAWKVGTWIDRSLMVVSVIGFSVPVFVVGYMLIYVFSINLRWLPVQGYSPIDQGFGPWIERLILPSIALGLAYVALIARITRTSMLEVLAEDYIRTANAKGVATRSMLLKHALKNAGVPIVTVIGIGVALLIGGVVITETVFNIPGVGRLVVDAISKRDYPIIQGVILIFSGVYVLVNLLVDLSYTLLDPRIRY